MHPTQRKLMKRIILFLSLQVLKTGNSLVILSQVMTQQKESVYS